MELHSSLLTIDLDAIADNYRLLRDRSQGVEIAAVVKADAYGLGVEMVAPVLSDVGCRCFFVATLEEGIELRGILDTGDVHVLNGPLPGQSAAFTDHKLVPVLNSINQIEEWNGHCRIQEEKLKADLHVDTGMSRLGMDDRERRHLETTPSLLEDLALDIVISHLACSDESEHPKNEQQLEKFVTYIGKFGGRRASLAASCGFFLPPEFHFQVVRAGIALFGALPVSDKPNPMAQVVRLQGKIMQVRSVDTPQTVGYGATHTIAGPGKIATVAVGYADGYPRSLSNSGTAFIGDYEVPIVGRVSMDLTTFDVSDIPDGIARPGVMVDLIGPHNSIDQLAKQSGTIDYEILTNLGKRYHRIYTGIEHEGACQ